MKFFYVTIFLFSTSLSFGSNTVDSKRGIGSVGSPVPGLGQFDPQHCACETCFTKYGVCTAVNQSKFGEKSRSNTKVGRGKGSKVDGI